MIEAGTDELIFSAPEVHPQARLRVSFQRTLRVPDDGRDYPLPAGLGRFPLKHVDDHPRSVPGAWLEHGGMMLPMHVTEAMWLQFSAGGYPWALKIAAGMINAVSGDPWSTGLNGPAAGGRPDRTGRAAEAVPQDYLVVPGQRWLDGFHSDDHAIRQFVAMPLGAGFSAEEQLSGEARYGGLQLLAYPMRAALYEQRRRASVPRRAMSVQTLACAPSPAAPDLGLGAGGRIVQQIVRDRDGVEAWDLDHPARCFVHLARAEQWPELTGRPAPTAPPTPHDYRAAGIPWFELPGVGPGVPGSHRLAEVRSVRELAGEVGLELADNDSIPVDRVIRVGAQSPVPPWFVGHSRDSSA